ncbi:uncharacterized protein LOC105202819 [Solenopsis invicta]|uniref:uncharacterized protein LOC105202819 n=1 Tax=Solenopsis invicta TaxID=13686 RepID=UPI000596003A|nr:uncharacterized protein LOC105202819 [Solenopsis invicta]XP_011169809.1 uncharacterized protein LOC105202819 [Solenopsis invicta]XP_039315131.1 uncharacterized protein LOC105202819 [Solenopsis invicta]
MQFNPRNVITLLMSDSFLNMPQTPTIEIEIEVKQKIENLLQSIYENELIVKEEVSLDFENSFDTLETNLITNEERHEADQPAYDVKEITCANDIIPIEYKRRAVEYWRHDEASQPTYNVKEMTCANDMIPIEYKRRAVKYWRRDDSVRPKSFENVKHRFRKLTSPRELRRWREQVNRGGTRLEKLKEISSYTLDKFKEAVQNGIIIHDTDIARWALKAQQEINCPGFTASPSWILRFKKSLNMTIYDAK